MSERIRWLGQRVRVVRRQAAVLLAMGLVFAVASGVGALSPQDAAKPAATGTAQDKKANPPAPKRGLVLNNPGALQGYTLLAPILSSKCFLIDMEGRVVRTWHSESSGALSTYLLENGHLLRHAKLNQQVFGDGPGGGGHIQEFSWDGELVWDFRFASAKQLAHHDIYKMPNGNVLMIVWEKKTAAEAVAAGRRPETVGKDGLLSEAIVEVQPTGKTTGKIVWEWHVWDHLVQDHDKAKANYADVGAHPELLDINFGEGAIASIVAKPEELEKLRAIGYIGSNTPGGKPAPVSADWLHCNAVAYNADLDQIVVSSPEFNEIWIIDHHTTTAEAASHKGGRHGKGGDLLYRWGNPRAYRAGTIKDQKLFYQHNIHWIPKGYPGEGHLLVFNNGKRRIGGAHSSVDELVLPVGADGRYTYKPGTAYGPEGPVWSYVAPKKADFYAEFISGAHRLPNGNTFICAGPSGTIFEVTPKMETVWKYLNPVQNELTLASAATPPPVEVVPASLRELLKVTDEQKKGLEDLRSEAEKKLEALLTEEQKKELQAPPQGGIPFAPPSAPKAVQVLPAFLRQRLKLTEEQKKQVDALQTDTESKLGRVLKEVQTKQLKEVRDGFVNTWGGGGPRPLGNALFRCYRYAANYPGLAGKDLKPGKTIEELQTEKSGEKK